MSQDLRPATLPTKTPTKAPPLPPATAPCPRCQKPLIDPAGLCWCKACGYCGSLETEQKNNKLMQAEKGPSRAAVFAGAAGQIPWWFWVLVVGVGALAAGSLAVGRLLPPGSNFARALFTSVQIGVGLVLIFAGQIVALVRIAPDDEKLSFKDAVVPTRLWGLVAKRLGELYGCLWTSVAGLGLIVFAIIFIGGLEHWMTYLPNSNKNQPPRPPAKKAWK